MNTETEMEWDEFMIWLNNTGGPSDDDIEEIYNGGLEEGVEGFLPFHLITDEKKYEIRFKEWKSLQEYIRECGAFEKGIASNEPR